jgi:hypothetical protein
MTFNELNTVGQMILDAISKRDEPRMARMNTDMESKRKKSHPWQSWKSVVSSVYESLQGWGDSFGGDLIPTIWDYIPAPGIPRQIGDVML